MFGLSLSEIFIIALVALIVIGPERLPKTARALGLLVGRAQRYVNDIKSDIEREMHVEDIKKFKDEVASNVTQVKSSVEGEIASVTDPLKKISNPLDAVKSEVTDLEKQLKGDLNPLPDLKELAIDKSVKEAVANPLSSASKSAAVKATDTVAKAGKATGVTAMGVVSDAKAEVIEPSEAFSVNPSASFAPTSTLVDAHQSTVAGGSLIYPDENDDSVASAADVIQQRWSAAEEQVSTDGSAPQQVAGIYDGPTFEPLEAPEPSPEEREAWGQDSTAFIEDSASPVDADRSLEGLALWEQMPQEPSDEEQVVRGQDGQAIADANTQDKKNSNDHGGLNV